MKYVTLLKWMGTILIAQSALIVAFSPHLAQLWPSFIGYTLGAFLWTYIALKTKDWSLLCLNIFYVVIDLYAIYTRL